MDEKQETLLREEIASLGEMLGDTIREIAGGDSLQIVEDLRRLAWDGRSGRHETGPKTAQFIALLSNGQLRMVIRAFSIFLDIMNLSEDRQRVRVLHERERNVFPKARGESIREAVQRLKLAGRPISETQQLLDQLHIELVFTAHPTEAKRRSVRGKLRKIRELLRDSDTDQLPEKRERTQQLIRAELAKLWQTDVIRPWRPSIIQEVRRGLSIKPVLWKVLPQIMREFRGSLSEAFPENQLRIQPCVTFGSWIGGDRDGHPGVTAEVTEQTFVWLRHAALDFHLATCDELFDSLTLSQRQLQLGDTLSNPLSAAFQLWPHLEKEVSGIALDEECRRWIGVIRWRLRQTQLMGIDGDLTEGAYASPSELAGDVSTLLDAVEQSPGGKLFSEEIRTWLDRSHIFGFHLARLDVRQDARQYREVLNELLQKLNLCADPEALDEIERQKILLSTLGERVHAADQEKIEGLSETAQETLDLFRLLHRVVKSFGHQALGGHVISMTNAPSDVLAVLWLWRLTASDAAEGDPLAHLPIVPLFETINDLQQGPAILADLLDIPEYREHLRQQGDRQIVMIGYSDSTKGGGYLSACWSLYEAQQKLHAAAAGYGVELTFFHGRGGSLGRGGGPAARGILSLPGGTFHGSLRLTEQGEVLADRYDDPIIAHRHLEQVVWSSLLACGEPSTPDREDWVDIMAKLSDTSYHKYRELVEQPGFVDFFRQATPISEVEQLPIGSRPSRRRGGGNLDDLRAIPWVFSWTQCRCLIPAWYGFGTAAAEILEDAELLQLLRSMYRDWPFFRATVDNAELALAKTDLGIAGQYAEMADDTELLARIEAMIAEEFHRTRDAILAITENDELIDGTPWLKESIRMRNRYIDPLNLVQIELLRRSRSCSDSNEEQAEELRHLIRLTINGLASGMRTSG
ncbi:MAG: phosphoenolpyruvate carboxylase [Planctomycetes bacterium]|nr:phosphoenolpyruvate carboxylase [Planctomycetota bacterium]